jgi:hypothetical protein
VPTRDSRAGAIKELFREVFEARRGRGLRADVDASRWGDFYRLGVNTQLVTSTARQAVIAVGMPLAVA